MLGDDGLQLLAESIVPEGGCSFGSGYSNTKRLTQLEGYSVLVYLNKMSPPLNHRVQQSL